MLKDNNKDARISKVNNKSTAGVVLVSSLSTLNKFHMFLCVFNVGFRQVNAVLEYVVNFYLLLVFQTFTFLINILEGK